MAKNVVLTVPTVVVQSLYTRTLLLLQHFIYLQDLCYSHWQTELPQLPLVYREFSGLQSSLPS